MSRFIAAFVALSFTLMMAPPSRASSDAGAMSCCVGKDSGHCDSGLMAESQTEPETEPICGLESVLREGISDVTNVVVADSSHRSAIDQGSIGKPCPGNCCACAISAAQHQTRDLSLLRAKLSQSHPITGQLYTGSTERGVHPSVAYQVPSLRGPPLTTPNTN